MSSDLRHRRVRRTLTAAGTSALLAIGFAAGFDAPATGAAGAAAAPPGPYSASAHGDIVDLDVDLLGGDLLGVKVGHSEVVSDTALTPKVVSTSSNLETRPRRHRCSRSTRRSRPRHRRPTRRR